MVSRHECDTALSVRLLEGGATIVSTAPEAIYPFEDAESLHRRVSKDAMHRPLFQILLDVRNATAGILDHTSLSDLCCRSRN